MTSPLLPKALSRIKALGVTVKAVCLNEFHDLIDAGNGTVLTNSSEPGAFCAYFVPNANDVVYRTSSTTPLRVSLRKRVARTPTLQLLGTGDSL